MTSPSSSPVATEPPECPICLESYDGATTIPRVLGCGHSACHQCLTNLRHHSSTTTITNTLRCPACTQLIPFPSSAPSSLPKNIDLLRFSLHPSAKPLLRKPPLPVLREHFFPDQLYTTWIHWILPYDAVTTADHLTGNIRLSNSVTNGVLRCRLVEHQQVRLLQLVPSSSQSIDHHPPVFEYTYVSKLMILLNSMTNTFRAQLLSLFSISLRVSRVCAIFGLWLDVETGCLYLVSEKLNNHSLLDFGGKDHKYVIKGVVLGTVAIELCEVLICLQREGFNCGCFGLSCVCFDDFGHLHLDLTEVLAKARKVRECVVQGVSGRLVSEEGGGFVDNVLLMDVFVSPEVLLELLSREGVEMDKNTSTFCASDVWWLGIILLRLVIGAEFIEEMSGFYKAVLETMSQGVSECGIMYLKWVDKVSGRLETIRDSDTTALLDIMLKCLDFLPECRPLIVDVWKNIRALNDDHRITFVMGFEGLLLEKGSDKCLALQELCETSNNLRNGSSFSNSNNEQDIGKFNYGKAGILRVGNVVKGLAAGKLQCKDLPGHMDRITGFCVGGGFVFSSSFDKTINIWSLEDFTLVHTFRGHEHRVMAVVFLAQDEPICISADSGGCIFTWEIVQPFSQEPLKKWYEEKDWRYSGIHALAVSESGYLYTGSGDRLIKVWSLRDTTLLCKMEGHKSVVSTLALTNGVLYSGSWDGTVRLWSLNDHSPLAVFGEEMPGILSSVLCLYADQNLVIAAYEKGNLKIWMDDVLKVSKQVHNGAAFALAMEENWLFSGGWDRTVHFQDIRGVGTEMEFQDIGSITCDSVITALMFVQGTLFVGYADKLIKVFY